jgi:hypothetical protein
LYVDGLKFSTLLFRFCREAVAESLETKSA